MTPIGEVTCSHPGEFSSARSGIACYSIMYDRVSSLRSSRDIQELTVTRRQLPQAAVPGC
jgi:hypothetical protein